MIICHCATPLLVQFVSRVFVWLNHRQIKIIDKLSQFERWLSLFLLFNRLERDIIKLWNFLMWCFSVVSNGSETRNRSIFFLRMKNSFKKSNNEWRSRVYVIIWYFIDSHFSFAVSPFCPRLCPVVDSIEFYGDTHIRWNGWSDQHSFGWYYFII